MSALAGFRRVFLACWILCSTLILCCGTARAQLQITATLSGTVTDASGGAIPGAAVTVTNAEQGFTRQTQTASDGRFAFALLPPGSYTLTIEKPGLSTYSYPGISLLVGQKVDISVTLQLKNVAQSIEVTAAVPPLNTEDANISTAVNTRDILELPLNQRNVIGLVFLNSQVTNQALTQWTGGTSTNQPNADQDISFLNFNGSRFGDTEFLLDGHWNTDGQWGAVMYVPGVDETAEFRLQSNSFSAQYGFSSGNVVNVITKGGTNALHGDVFEFIRNSDLDANNFFANASGIPMQHFERNQFGFSLGGPVVIPHVYNGKDKTFFFGEYEGLRAQSPVTSTVSVPTTAERNGDFSALIGSQIGTDALGRPIYSGEIYNPYTTRAITAGQVDSVTGLVASQTGYIRDPFQSNGQLNVIPKALWDSLGTKLVGYYPSPTNGALSNNFVASAASPQQQDGYSIRIDQNITDKSRLFGRWSHKDEYKTGSVAIWGNNPAGPGLKNPDNRYDFALNYVYTFSPTLVMSANFGLGRWIEQNVSIASPFNVTQLGWPAALNIGGGTFPSITPGNGYQSLGSAGAPQDAPRTNESYGIDFTKSHGAHVFTFGWAWDDLHYNNLSPGAANLTFPTDYTAGPDPLNPATNSGNGLAALLVGAGYGSFTQTGSQTSQKSYFAWYLGDDWKVNQKLTLNLGLRYEFQTSPTDRFNTLSWFNPTATNPISQQVGLTVPGELVFTGGANGRNVINPNYLNFAPRAGLAYRALEKLVFRAAYGIFYPAQMSLAVDANLNGFTQNTPWGQSSVAGQATSPVTPLSQAFQGGLLPLQGSALGGLTNVGLSVNAIQRQWHSPYVQNWTGGFQYAFTSNDTFEAQYVGNHGIRLPISGSLNINQLPDADLSLPVSYLTANVLNPFYGAITSSSCGLNNPTVQRGQLLRPFPEFCDVMSQQLPIAFDTYNALLLNWTHRFSHGLQLLASYTRSKWLDDTTGNPAWSWGASNSQFRDNNNITLDKTVDASDTPNSMVLSFVYQLPYGRGRQFGSNANKVVDAIAGGWQVSGIATFRSGVPLDITSSENTTYSFGGSQNPNVIANPSVPNPTVERWFNTNAFVYASPQTFGTSPRNLPYLRGPGTNNWDLAAEKWFHFTERFRLQFRAEFFDAFNHPRFTNPDTNLGDANFGVISGAFAPRDIQGALKLYW